MADAPRHTASYGAVESLEATDAHIDVAVPRDTATQGVDLSARSHRKIVGALFLAATVVRGVSTPHLPPVHSSTVRAPRGSTGEAHLVLYKGPGVTLLSFRT